MKRLFGRKVAAIVAISVFSVLLIANANAPVHAQATNLLSNASFETGSVNAANDWFTAYWGNLRPVFEIKQGGAQEGQRYAKVTVRNRTNGDARWEHVAPSVTAGATYTFSSWYMSNVPTMLNVAVTDTSGKVSYYWLAGPAASTTWKQVSVNYVMPAGAAKASFYHLINRNGWLATDNMSVTQVGEVQNPPVPPNPTPTPPPPPPNPTPTPPPPPPALSTAPFSKPIVSIEFDDGWTTAYNLGLPAVESFGWKPTQYIITDTALNNANYGGSYMNNNQILDWNRRGDIGSHSVTHRHIPNLGLTEITNELTNSKAYLDALLGEQTRLYVSPYCESSATVLSVAMNLYQSVRNCVPTYNSAANFNRWDLKSYIVLNTTSDSELTSILNETKNNKGWLILVWHEIAGDNKNAWSVSEATLRRQLQLVKNSGIEVVTTQQALNFSMGL